MRAFFQAALLGAAICLAPASSLPAKPAAAVSPFNGTWQLNVAHSKFSGPAIKGETRDYEVSGMKVTMHSSVTDAAGKVADNSYSAAFDGKPYPTVGNPIADTIALRRLNPHVVTAILKKGSTVSATARAIVSQDGRHLTIARTVRTGKTPVVNRLAYDKK